ncbi:MAG: type III secretion system cytoplasmic ring protein SctQ [Pseudomonadota bacterium]
MMDRSASVLDDGPFSAAAGRGYARADVHSFDPPAVDPAHLPLIHQLSRRCSPIAIAMGDAALAFTPIGLGSIDDIAPPAERVIFWLSIDGRPLLLIMAVSLFERILSRIDPELLAANLDGEILPLLLESCIEDGLIEAETRLRGRIELNAIEKGAAFDLDGLDVAIEIAIDGEAAGTAAFRAAPADVERLAVLFAARSAAQRSYGDLKTAISFRAGALWLDLGALRSLKTGDVLLVEEDASRWERMAATAGEHWLFPVEMTRKGPTVTGPFRRADAKDQEEWMMVENSRDDDEEGLSEVVKGVQNRTPATPAKSEAAANGADPAAMADEADEQTVENADAGPAPPPADAAFDDLPIKLVFELGRLDLPLGELQEIGRGHVFQLERPLGQAVEIHAGGRRIGQGEVVRIDDQIGVRVVRLFGQNGA